MEDDITSNFQWCIPINKLISDYVDLHEQTKQKITQKLKKVPLSTKMVNFIQAEAVFCSSDNNLTQQRH